MTPVYKKTANAAVFFRRPEKADMVPIFVGSTGLYRPPLGINKPRKSTRCSLPGLSESLSDCVLAARGTTKSNL